MKVDYIILLQHEGERQCLIQYRKPVLFLLFDIVIELNVSLVSSHIPICLFESVKEVMVPINVVMVGYSGGWWRWRNHAFQFSCI